MRVGFVGLGDQGGPMARRVIDGGLPTTLWARRLESVEPFLDTTAAVADSRRALGAGSDLIFTCVFDADGTREILFGPDGILAGMSPGGIVAVHSTVAPEEILDIAGGAAAQGITVVDAPVSGGGVRAAEGKLVVMAGGDRSAYERCLPVFATYADQIFHVGDVGAGQRAKLINNALMAAQLGLAADALQLGRELGLHAGGLSEVLRQGSGRSYALEVLVRSGSFDAIARSQAGRTLGKDVRLLTSTAATTAGAGHRPLLATATNAISMVESRLAEQA
jgi:3-hydroxyisobutyrate dehydrogenase-like beta-hydroxyacid dehydrogenase